MLLRNGSGGPWPTTPPSSPPKLASTGKNLTSCHFRRTHRPTPATRPAPRPPHTSRQLLTHLAEDLTEEVLHGRPAAAPGARVVLRSMRSEEHTSELQSRQY